MSLGRRLKMQRRAFAQTSEVRRLGTYFNGLCIHRQLRRSSTVCRASSRLCHEELPISDYHSDESEARALNYSVEGEEEGNGVGSMYVAAVENGRNLGAPWEKKVKQSGGLAVSSDGTPIEIRRPPSPDADTEATQTLRTQSKKIQRHCILLCLQHSTFSYQYMTLSLRTYVQSDGLFSFG